MTEREAKTILHSYGPPTNIRKHIEAIEVATKILGEEATMEEIWRWASEKRDAETDKSTV